MQVRARTPVNPGVVQWSGENPGIYLKESADAGTPNLFEQLGFVPVLIGIAVATVSAMLAVKWLVAFLNKHGLSAFGYYRIALTLVLGALIFTNTVSF